MALRKFYLISLFLIVAASFMSYAQDFQAPVLSEISVSPSSTIGHNNWWGYINIYYDSF